MAVSLSKGGNVNLSKEAPGLTHILIGLGWDARATDGAAFDLDTSTFMLNADGKVASDECFIFYNNKTCPCGSVVYGGDNLTGQGDGDDEVVRVELSKVPANVEKIAVTVTIDKADSRKQNFGQVSHAYIRVVNDGNATEIARYDLSEDASTETAMVFGEIYRAGAEWKFKAIGQGFNGGLAPLAASFGVNI